MAKTFLSGAIRVPPWQRDKSATYTDFFNRLPSQILIFALLALITFFLIAPQLPRR